MTPVDANIALLALGVCAILAGLTILGEILRARQPADRANPVLDTYQTRVESWWVIVILLSLALLAGRTGAVLLALFASFAALREFLTLTVKARADHLSLALAFFVVLPVQYVFIWLGWTGAFTVFIPVYAFLLLPVVSALRGQPERFLVRVAETQWALMICVYCLSHVAALLTLGSDDDSAVLLIAFLFLTVQFGDLLDYFFGRRIGRRRIAPGLSPKTWEGVASGIGSAALIGTALHWITPFGLAGAAAIAALISAAGMMGHLVFAAIKRDKGVRDWSHLIPGQGGVLDQLDTVIFAAPVFYHVTRIATV